MAAPATPDPQKQIAMIAKAVGMDPNLLSKIATVLGLDSSATPDDVKKAIEDFSAKMDQITALLDNGGPAAGAADAPPVDATALNPPDSAPAMAAASVRLSEMTGRATLSEQLDEVATWRESHLEREREQAKLAADRVALEAGERRKLVAELVRLGREVPATAWADDSAKTPAAFYADMPIATLRDRVEKLRAGAPAAGGPVAPTGTDAHGLTDHQLAICKETGCDPEIFARLSAGR